MLLKKTKISKAQDYNRSFFNTENTNKQMHLSVQDKFPYHTVGTTTAIILGQVMKPSNSHAHRSTFKIQNTNTHKMHELKRKYATHNTSSKKMKSGRQKSETTYTAATAKPKDKATCWRGRKYWNRRMPERPAVNWELH